MGNDKETSELLSPALVFHRFKNSYTKIILYIYTQIFRSRKSESTFHTVSFLHLYIRSKLLKQSRPKAEDTKRKINFKAFP